MHLSALKFTTLFLALGVMSACVSQRPRSAFYQTQIVEQWVGKHAQELWDQWGPPTHTLEAPDGSIVYLYQATLGAPGSRAVANTMPVQSTQAGATTAGTIACESFFNVDAVTKQIRTANWRGAKCAIRSPEERQALLRSSMLIGW